MKPGLSTWRKGLLLAAVMVSACLGGSCGRGFGSRTLHVSLYVGDPHLRFLQNAVKGFEARHPGWKVSLDYTPYTAYQQKIVTQVAGGNPPDLLMLEVNNFADLYLRGFLEDLTPYVQKDGLDLSDVYPGVLKRFSPEGHLSVLPQDTAPMGLVYYNKKLFREAGVPYPKAGWSWPEPFLSTCKKLVKRDAAGKTVQWAYCESYVTNCTNFLWTAGGLLVDDTDKPTRLTLDSPECLKGYRFYWDMMHKLGVTPSPSNLQGFGVNDSVESMFLNGKLAMMTTGLWQVPKFLAQPGLEFDVVPFPKGPTGIKAWGTGGSGFAVAKSCRNKGLAWDLAKTLCSDEVVSQLASTGWIMPAKKSLAKSDAFLKSPGPAGKAYLPDMPEFSRYEPFLKTWTEMYYGQVYPALDPVWNGDKTPEQTLPDVTAAVNRKYFAK